MRQVPSSSRLQAAHQAGAMLQRVVERIVAEVEPGQDRPPDSCCLRLLITLQQLLCCLPICTLCLNQLVDGGAELSCANWAGANGALGGYEPRPGLHGLTHRPSFNINASVSARPAAAASRPQLGVCSPGCAAAWLFRLRGDRCAGMLGAEAASFASIPALCLGCCLALTLVLLLAPPVSCLQLQGQ